jgi:hypothetical protein
VNAIRAPLRCAGIAGVAAWLDMNPETLAKAMGRNLGWPLHDVEITPGRGSHPERGWVDTEERRAEWAAWRASLPGRGAGGGRPRLRATQEDGETR